MTASPFPTQPASPFTPHARWARARARRSCLRPAARRAHMPWARKSRPASCLRRSTPSMSRSMSAANACVCRFPGASARRGHAGRDQLARRLSGRRARGPSSALAAAAAGQPQWTGGLRSDAAGGWRRAFRGGTAARATSSSASTAPTRRRLTCPSIVRRSRRDNLSTCASSVTGRSTRHGLEFSNGVLAYFGACLALGAAGPAPEAFPQGATQSLNVQNADIRAFIQDVSKATGQHLRRRPRRSGQCDHRRWRADGSRADDGGLPRHVAGARLCRDPDIVGRVANRAGRTSGATAFRRHRANASSRR